MAVGFNASGDVASRADNLPSTTWTICGWVKVTSIRENAFQYFAGIDNANLTYELLGFNSSGYFELSWGDIDGGGSTFPQEPPVDEWFYFAIVKSGTGDYNLTGYFKAPGDTWMQASFTGYGQTIGNDVLNLGNDGWGEYVNCHMAHVRVWASALNTTELDAEMESATPVKSNVLMDWPLADNTDTGDDSGNGYDLTFSGTITTETGPTFGSSSDLNTRSKRASAVQLMKPFAMVLPLPDNTIDQGDRQHLSWLYSGILAIAETIAGQPYILRLFGVPTMSRRDRPGGWN